MRLKPVLTIPTINVFVVAEMLPPVITVLDRTAPLVRPEELIFARIPLTVTLVSPEQAAVQTNVNVIVFVPEPIRFKLWAAPKTVPLGVLVSTGRGKVLMLSGVVEVASNTVLAGLRVMEIDAWATPRVPTVQFTATVPKSSTVAS